MSTQIKILGDYTKTHRQQLRILKRNLSEWVDLVNSNEELQQDDEVAEKFDTYCSLLKNVKTKARALAHIELMILL
ncbi:MAG: hypothetical protein GY810_06455 [Aureispira sp.]|nr:hypothetical protein [Aureispira sp.]